MKLTFDAKKVVGTYTVSKEITEAEVETIIVNGLESGIGYWACLHNNTPDFEAQPENEPVSMWTTKLLLEGKTIIFSDAEGEDESLWELTLPKLLRGIELNMQERPHDCDIENGDATTYDCIIQYALFDDIVFA